MRQSIPIRTIHLFEELDFLLLDKLRDLSSEDWGASTLAGSWTVKQVVSHLLDGNLRALSMLRDGYFGENPGDVNSYEDLVSFLNRLNADWVKATQRLSPKVLISLLESSGREYRALLRSLKPFEKALFSVAWAGEEESLNWFHIAREYTEKWHHTQQIFLALNPNDKSLFSKRLYLPFLDTAFRALPYHYRSVKSPTGTLIKFSITGEFSFDWWLKKTISGWQLLPFSKVKPSSEIAIPDHIAWRIFTKGLRSETAKKAVDVTGDQELGHHLLTMLTVMA
ncbi:maleylpyruvate isomerase N-terminal domain-containing protein [Algoriphagus marincola]|uniref:maleylpyruvate isomerase N-terminal domain-containing protein n=1 Tax=Algoriphagus marincola TaxID=264027 RepID=UPI00040AAB43|nr:maleylpyruvate isomerase N-terminal domain-containing protein [Algoriphagus marincola]